MIQNRLTGGLCLGRVLMSFVVVSALVTGGMWSYSAKAATAIAQAEQQQVSGTVVDAQGAPVPGASVIELGTSNGVMTDNQGRFTINVRRGATLQISCIGYATAEVAASNGMRVVLSEDAEFLDEVVVVGYGTQKRANLTGAVSTVDVSKTLESKSTASIGKALQGAVPGLTILNTSGDINAEPSIVIRGIGTLSNSGTSTPLYVVDGVPMDNLS
ncbi:MAG: carboxypeptidase-like regulatory domain-containing protein, partial [Bacteroidales bacterium]|nr:carboxypeptidase-like regulatory domain-containing protein [Bacteroidales bacterium]